jgi:hypothetical protein
MRSDTARIGTCDPPQQRLLEKRSIHQSAVGIDRLEMLYTENLYEVESGCAKQRRYY